MRRLIKYCSILFVIFFVSCSQNFDTDWYLNFDRNSKEPFGCYIAYNQLKEIFPTATITATNNLISKIKKSNNNNSVAGSQLAIAVLNEFEIEADELDEMLKFIDNGNSIVILANKFSDTLLNFLEVKSIDKLAVDSNLFKHDTIGPTSFVNSIIIKFKDTLHTFSYKGMRMDSYFEGKYKLSQYHTTIGWVDSSKRKNLLQYQNGGSMVIGHSPLSLTNHFMLQGNNRMYFEYLLSRYNTYTDDVLWYSKLKHIHSDTESDNAIFKFPPLFKAFVTMLFLLLVYLLFEGKRRQRIMKKLTPKQNDSLEFVETVGRLYYNKRDHKNLAEKMITYYLENLRSTYGFKTQKLDELFAIGLAHKVNQSESDAKEFVSYLNYIRKQPELNEIDIQHLHKQLNKFT